MMTPRYQNQGSYALTKKSDVAIRNLIAFGTALACMLIGSLILIRFNKYFQHLIDGFNAIALQFIIAGFGPAIACIAFGIYKWCKINKPSSAHFFSSLLVTTGLWTLLWTIRIVLI